MNVTSIFELLNHHTKYLDSRSLRLTDRQTDKHTTDRPADTSSNVPHKNYTYGKIEFRNVKAVLNSNAA